MAKASETTKRRVERILALDPGGTTGWATCSLKLVSEGGSPVKGVGTRDETYYKKFKWGTFSGDVGKQSWRIGNKISKKRCRVIIHETSDHFLLQSHRRQMRKHSLIPIELAGAVKALVSVLNHRYLARLGQYEKHASVHPETAGWFTVVRVEQTPSQAKSVITDEILKAYGFPVKKMQTHERDAVRHLLLFIRRMYSSGGMADYILSELRSNDAEDEGGE